MKNLEGFCSGKKKKPREVPLHRRQITVLVKFTIAATMFTVELQISFA